MTERKMTGKQPVVGNFDLNQFVSGSEPGAAAEIGKSAPKIPRKAEKLKPPKVKPQKPLLTERAQIKLTVREMQTLKEKAGLAPVSVYLRKYLKDNGLI